MTPDANDLCVFAIKRGNIESRFDCHFYLPSFQNIISTIKQRKHTTLGEIAEFSSVSSDFSEFEDGVFDYLEISGIVLGLNQYKTSKTEVSEAPSRAKLKTQNDDIVISLTRPQRGAIAQIKNNGIIASTGFSIIHNVKEGIDKKWLLNTLLSRVCLQQMLQRSSGGNYPAIIEEDLKKIYIPCIDYNVQLNMVFNLENRLNIYKKKTYAANELITSLNHYILSSLGIAELGHNYRLVSAIRLLDVINDSTFSPEYYHPERMSAIHTLELHQEIRTKKLSDIVRFQKDVVISGKSNEEYLGLAGVESQTGELSGIAEEAAGQAFVYQVGDVLYGRLRPYLNKVIVAETSGICSTEFHVMRVIDENEIIPEYLAAIMRSPLILAQTKHMMTGNTHPRISNDDVKNLYIPIPEIDVQREIASELNKRRKEARKLKEEAEQEWADAKAQFEKELLG